MNCKFIYLISTLSVPTFAFWCSTKYFSGRLISRIDGAIAVEAEETIDPTSFSRDLYKCLGVKQNSSRIEIKEKYWAIAAQNHPDRNKSQAALEIFRNASYAYKILKDPIKRREYDGSQQTKLFVDVIREVGNDIIVPLTMDVAVPLINLTMNSISAFAMPFIRDAFEQTSAILNATMQTEDDDPELETSLDYFKKAAQNVAQARDSVSWRQRLRRLREQQSRSEIYFAKHSLKLKDAKEKEEQAMSLQEDQKRTVEVIRDRVRAGQRKSSQFTTAFTTARDKETASGTAYKAQSTQLNTLLNRSSELSFAIGKGRLEVARLEAALAAARATVLRMETEYEATTVLIEPEKQKALILLDDFKLKITTREVLSTKLKSAEISRAGLELELRVAEGKLEEAKENTLRQQEFRGILERKAADLEADNATLLRRLRETEMEVSRREAAVALVGEAKTLPPAMKTYYKFPEEDEEDSDWQSPSRLSQVLSDNSLFVASPEPDLQKTT